MPTHGTVYNDLGVRTVINGVGTRTQVSGSLLREGVAEAMAEASEAYVHITDLQARASKLITEITGAEAGFVSAGAASGLMLATAACIAGTDFKKMAMLPDTEDIPSDVVIPRGHYIKYARAFEAAGGDLNNVGIVTHHPVEGGSDVVSAWELDAAIEEETIAVAYIHKDHNILSLETVVDVAHDNDVPVIVDAASELPPKSNLERFIDAGADLVSFSGGKAIRGPQSTGILAGRKDLIASAAMQQLSDGYHDELWDPPANLIDTSDLPGTPPTGIGRPMKVGKEDIVGLITALKGFLEEDEDTLLAEWNDRAERITAGLDESDALEVKRSGMTVIARLTGTANRSALELIRVLRDEDPRVWVGENRTHLNEFTVKPQALSDEEADYLVERVLANV